MHIQEWVGARLGLMGNPSDGFGGKTLACLIGDFRAAVCLRESRTIEIVRHPLFDPLTFQSLDHLSELAACDGYYGGIRLLFATCKRFSQHCREAGILLPAANFTLQYDTNIPRQVGLGGSSAIITAAYRALMTFYGLTERDLPAPVLPNLILATETEELGIAAGLQDRVIQVYGGLVYMDFDPARMQAHGHGLYEPLPLDLLPPLYLAYEHQPSDSGKIHSPVRHRFHQGDPEVLAAVKSWADYTDAARAALLRRDWATFADLMNRNFDLRLHIYGDEFLGARNLEMVSLARSLGLPAKFAGSGGAVIGICEDPELLQRARNLFTAHGYGFLVPTPVAYDSPRNAVPPSAREAPELSLGVA